MLICTDRCLSVIIVLKDEFNIFNRLQMVFYSPFMVLVLLSLPSTVGSSALSGAWVVVVVVGSKIIYR